MSKIDRILISVDDNPQYIEFLPIYSLACQKTLNIKPTLAYITDRKESEWRWMHDYCQNILRFPVYHNLPNGKCGAFAARMVMRYKFWDDVCMIGDIDLIPLDGTYFSSVMEHFLPDKFLSVGYNVFKFGDGDPESKVHDPALRKFPSCYTIATSKVWQKIVNPHCHTDDILIREWYDLQIFDHKEAVNRENFCDESLMRALIQQWNPSRSMVIGIDRDIVGNKMIDRIDRSFWEIDKDRLRRGEYIDAHCPRPLSNYQDSIRILTDYMEIPFIIGK